MAKMATREAYGQTLAALAAENENILVLDADLSGSTKSGMVKKNNPNQHGNRRRQYDGRCGRSCGKWKYCICQQFRNVCDWTCL